MNNHLAGTCKESLIVVIVEFAEDRQMAKPDPNKSASPDQEQPISSRERDEE